MTRMYNAHDEEGQQLEADNRKHIHAFVSFGGGRGLPWGEGDFHFGAGIECSLKGSLSGSQKGVNFTSLP